jgi:hypothetical protein
MLCLINLVDKTNSKFRLRRWLAFLCTVILIACEEEPLPQPVDRVIPELVRPYVDQFMVEAEKRGVQLDTSKLSFGFDRDVTISLAGDQKTVVGSCSRSDNLNLVTIDTLNALWLLSGYLGKEEIVFHELGHCLLHRVHRDDRLVSGEFASIMRTVGLLQYGDLNSYTGIFLPPAGIKAHRRDYYLDELFNQSATPCWSDPQMPSPYPVITFRQDFIENREYRYIWIDPDDNFWLYGGEVNYRYQNGVFSNPLTSTQITAMNNNGGLLWIAGRINRQVVIGTYTEGELEIRYDLTNLLEEDTRIERLLVEGSGRVWFSDNKGNLFVNSGNGFNRVAFSSREWVTKLLEGPDNKVYILKGGRFFIVEDAQNFVQVSRNNANIPVDFFRNLAVDGNGVAWLHPGASNPFIIQFFNDFEARRLNFRSINLVEIRINDLVTDPSGNIWAATSNGLRKWDGDSFSSYCDYNTGLDILDFSSIGVSQNGDIWSIGRDTTNLQRTLLLAQPGG